ncbi:hypothetical protein [Thiorhodovibrio winogradskyi]|uniref:hypothetical protein n=1 Tax=Thiorhodovibrio winogradskyi TaxID=77007 RepID=UPI002E2A0BB4|nr:hypothetical protein [Thiorhodovibrio winogradskyi]
MDVLLKAAGQVTATMLIKALVYKSYQISLTTAHMPPNRIHFDVVCSGKHSKSFPKAFPGSFRR